MGELGEGQATGTGVVARWMEVCEFGKNHLSDPVLVLLRGQVKAQALVTEAALTPFISP